VSSYVVGVDGSGPSRAALRWAVARAVETGTPITLAHVIEDEWGLVGGDFARGASYAGGRVLQDASREANDLDPAVPVDTRLLHGSPVRALADTSAVDDALVIGTHKTGFLRGRVLGSRSVAIAAVAPCSVVVVPDGITTSRRGIVAGVAGPDGDLHGVVMAAREAARLRQPLLLVHAWQERSEADQEQIVQRQRILIQHAIDIAKDTSPEVELHMRVSPKAPAEALLDAARDAVLLVLEPTRAAAIGNSVLGSTTHDVLMNITVPVLVARGDRL
jgi:nucleotide-binding universal stress UspA family protein